MDASNGTSWGSSASSDSRRDRQQITSRPGANGILENYAKNNKRIVGVEASFLQGDCLNGVVAAEKILRSTYPGWTEQNTTNIQRYFRDVWWILIGIGKPNCGSIAV